MTSSRFPCIILAILICGIFQSALASSKKISPSVTNFFPEINGNLTSVTWAHAVNSQKELDDALETNTIMMLEADVVMGTLTTGNSDEQIPVMGHPPANTSDLSLEEFLKRVLKDNKRGVKLDFKTIEVFNASQDVLRTLRPNMTFPVWINGDILFGPVEATGIPVDSASFLTGAADVFPESTLSIGWITRYGTNADPPITEGSYNDTHVDEMLAAIKNVDDYQPITYPVRAGLAANSSTELQRLMKESPKGTTLTIWSSEGDEVDAANLSTLIKTIGVDKVYVDVPDALLAELDFGADSSGMRTSAIAFGALLAAVILVRLF